jgi:hypothetical protein
VNCVVPLITSPNYTLPYSTASLFITLAPRHDLTADEIALK